MARQVRQTLPDPPPEYDQAYVAALVRSVNSYMSQAQAQGEVIAGRFIMTDPLKIPGGVETAGLPLDTTDIALGTLYLKLVPALFAANVTSATPAATSSTTPVMMGLAMVFETIYTQTGICIINGQVGNTSNGTTVLSVVAGHGTPPVNGATIPVGATVVGLPVTYQGPASGAITPFSQTVLLTAITPGIPQWIDVAVHVSSGNSIVQDVEFVAFGLRDTSEFFVARVDKTDP
jgi:hypothetical protein